jgi:hypothetical protein
MTRAARSPGLEPPGRREQSRVSHVRCRRPAVCLRREGRRARPPVGAVAPGKGGPEIGSRRARTGGEQSEPSRERPLREFSARTWSVVGGRRRGKSMLRPLEHPRRQHQCLPATDRRPPTTVAPYSIGAVMPYSVHSSKAGPATPGTRSPACRMRTVIWPLWCASCPTSTPSV